MEIPLSGDVLKNGYLSADLTSHIAKIRAHCAPWFEHAERLNQLAQRIATTQSDITSDTGLADARLLALMLQNRALSNFQGTILMTERGMIVEARTLARSCLESALCLAGIGADPEHWRSMLHDELASKKARGKFILKNVGTLDPSRRKALSEYVENLEKQKGLSTLKYEEVAEKAGVGGLYLFYRQLSADAAHPSITALNRYVSSEKDDEVKEIQWMPVLELDEVVETIALACSFLMLACTALGQMLPNADRNRELQECYNESYR